MEDLLKKISYFFYFTIYCCDILIDLLKARKLA